MRRSFSKVAVLAMLLLAIVASGCGTSADGARAASTTNTTRPDHVVAESAGKPAPAVLAPIMHTVAPGDQLSTIAKQHQVTWKRLFDANPTLTFADGHTVPFANQDQLVVGASLRIPYYWETFPSRQPHINAPPVVVTKSGGYHAVSASGVPVASRPARWPSGTNACTASGSLDASPSACVRWATPCAIPTKYCNRESRGYINIWNHDGSGASGKYQFMPSTWNGYGGYAYAAWAPESLQDQKAREIYDGGNGCSNWGC